MLTWRCCWCAGPRTPQLPLSLALLPPVGPQGRPLVSVTVVRMPAGRPSLLHLRWGRFFLLCSYQFPVNGFPCFLCSSAPGYRGVLCRLSGIWDMSPLNGQNPRRAGEDSPPEREEPAATAPAPPLPLASGCARGPQL